MAEILGELDISRLPKEIRDRLAQLDLELSEGDITQKGYEKKKLHLLGPFIQGLHPGGRSNASPSTRAHRRHQRRLTRDENRYHSEIRAEAVQQALAQYAHGVNQRPSVLQPVKRRGHHRQRNTKQLTITDSSSEEDSLVENSQNNFSKLIPISSQKLQEIEDERTPSPSTSNGKMAPPPDVTRPAQALISRSQGGKIDSDDVVYANTTASPPSQYQNSGNIRPAKVSLKIQQLLNTLQRPKKKPLHEYYNDDDAELEAMAKVVDPTAPKPEGAIISPARGEQIQLPPNLPRSLDSALQRYGSANYKNVAASVLDQSGRPSITMTYGKLLSRSQKVAYLLLNKLGQKENRGLSPGDRVSSIVHRPPRLPREE